MKITKRQLRRIIKEEKRKLVEAAFNEGHAHLVRESVSDMAEYTNMIDDFAIDLSDKFQESMLSLWKEEPGIVSRGFNEEAFRAAQRIENDVAAAVREIIITVEAMLHNGDFDRE